MWSVPVQYCFLPAGDSRGPPGQQREGYKLLLLLLLLLLSRFSRV